jgi:hypothetical protein
MSLHHAATAVNAAAPSAVRRDPAHASGDPHLVSSSTAKVPSPLPIRTGVGEDVYTPKEIAWNKARVNSPAALHLDAIGHLLGAVSDANWGFLERHPRGCGCAYCTTDRDIEHLRQEARGGECLATTLAGSFLAVSYRRFEPAGQTVGAKLRELADVFDRLDERYAAEEAEADDDPAAEALAIIADRPNTDDADPAANFEVRFQAHHNERRIMCPEFADQLDGLPPAELAPEMDRLRRRFAYESSRAYRDAHHKMDRLRRRFAYESSRAYRDAHHIRRIADAMHDAMTRYVDDHGPNAGVRVLTEAGLDDPPKHANEESPDQWFGGAHQAISGTLFNLETLVVCLEEFRDPPPDRTTTPVVADAATAAEPANR